MPHDVQYKIFIFGISMSDSLSFITSDILGEFMLEAVDVMGKYPIQRKIRPSMNIKFIFSFLLSTRNRKK
jgi:hypothetical protein